LRRDSMAVVALQRFANSRQVILLFGVRGAISG
jgi:hypothetical protein